MAPPTGPAGGTRVGRRDGGCCTNFRGRLKRCFEALFRVSGCMGSRSVLGCGDGCSCVGVLEKLFSGCRRTMLFYGSVSSFNIR